MAKNDKIWHDGIVKCISGQTIEVVINSHSACSGCHAKGACGMSDMTEKSIMAPLPAAGVSVGDQVIVYATMNNAIYSVLLAYVVPSLVIIATLFILLAAGCSEIIAAILSLVLTGLYFYALYLLRKRIGKKITFTVEKQNNK